MHRYVVTDMSPDPKRPDRNVTWPKPPRPKQPDRNGQTEKSCSDPLHWNLFFVDFKYEEKCWKPVFLWLFLVFGHKWNGARIILQKCPWKPI